MWANRRFMHQYWQYPRLLRWAYPLVCFHLLDYVSTILADPDWLYLQWANEVLVSGLHR